MVLNFHPLLLIPLAAAALALFFAIVVFRAEPRRDLNRRLGLVLAAEGLIPMFFVLATTFEDVTGWGRGAEEAGWMGGGLCLIALPWLYVLFLSSLPSPLVGFTRDAKPQALFRALPPAMMALFAVLTVGTVGTKFERGPVSEPLFNALGATEITAAITASLFALLVAFDTFRRAKSLGNRAQARSFTLAFGIRDGLVVMALGAGVVSVLLGGNPPVIIYFLMLGGLVFAYVPFLAYGVLRTQLFDLDIRMRWTISHGAVLAVIAAAALGASEVAVNYLNDEFGLAAGGLVAAGMLLAARPLQRLADRMTGRVMPQTEHKGAHLAARRKEIYEAAVEGALADREITYRERNVLAALQDKLGLSARDALATEKAMRKRLGLGDARGAEPIQTSLRNS